MICWARLIIAQSFEVCYVVVENSLDQLASLLALSLFWHPWTLLKLFVIGVPASGQEARSSYRHFQTDLGSEVFRRDC